MSQQGYERGSFAAYTVAKRVLQRCSLVVVALSAVACAKEEPCSAPIKATLVNPDTYTFISKQDLSVSDASTISQKLFGAYVFGDRQIKEHKVLIEEGYRNCSNSNKMTGIMNRMDAGIAGVPAEFGDYRLGASPMKNCDDHVAGLKQSVSTLTAHKNNVEQAISVWSAWMEGINPQASASGISIVSYRSQATDGSVVNDEVYCMSSGKQASILSMDGLPE